MTSLHSRIADAIAPVMECNPEGRERCVRENASCDCTEATNRVLATILADRPDLDALVTELWDFPFGSVCHDAAQRAGEALVIEHAARLQAEEQVATAEPIIRVIVTQERSITGAVEDAAANWLRSYRVARLAPPSDSEEVGDE